MLCRQPAVDDLAHGNAERPAHHEHPHCSCEFLAGEPVRDHLCEVDRAEDKADPAQCPTDCQLRESACKRCEPTANGQGHEPERHEGPIRRTMSQPPRWQGEDEAWKHEEAYQCPDLCKAQS